MNKVERAQMLFDALDARAREESLELIDVEVKGQANNPIVIVFLDKEGGIGIDDLTAANKWIDLIFDELITTRYTLEVSSPGGRAKRSTTEN
jgi:ribosome maturation factor RimP